MTRELPFTKVTACGNDFLIADGAFVAEKDLAEVTRYACSRSTGVGADGVEWLYADSGSDVKARLFNSDGSEAELSGNGTRCVAAYWAARSGRDEVKVLTAAGLKYCKLTSREGRVFHFEMALGSTVSVSEEIEIKAASGKLRGRRVWVGNPHFVVFVDSFPVDWREAGAELSIHKEFPDGVNVEFVRVVDRRSLEFRIWERGAGETQSSGTGSCAVAVAAISQKLATAPVVVEAPGGSQRVRWKRGGELFLEGPAELICQGNLYL